MKDITTIIFRLTVSCLMAGLVMGTAFVFTNKAKIHNAHVNQQRAMLGLLGYSKNKPAPSSLVMHEIYRYIIAEEESLSLGYLLPVVAGGNNGYNFVTIGLDGKFLKNKEIKIAEEKVTDEGERHNSILAALGNGKSIRFADHTRVVTNNGKRTAYLFAGRVSGLQDLYRSDSGH